MLDLRGDDGNYYFLSATALLKWMKATFGTPSTPYHILGSQGGQNGVNFPSIMSNLPVNNGIYIMIPNISGDVQVQLILKALDFVLLVMLI